MPDYVPGHEKRKAAVLRYAKKLSIKHTLEHDIPALRRKLLYRVVETGQFSSVNDFATKCQVNRNVIFNDIQLIGNKLATYPYFAFRYKQAQTLLKSKRGQTHMKNVVQPASVAVFSGRKKSCAFELGDD